MRALRTAAGRNRPLFMRTRRPTASVLLLSRTLMFGADQDLLLPSEEEVKRLAGKLRRGRAKVVPGRSHAMLMEVGVDLQQMIDDEGFYTRMPHAPKALRVGAGPVFNNSAPLGGGVPHNPPPPAPECCVSSIFFHSAS